MKKRFFNLTVISVMIFAVIFLAGCTIKQPTSDDQNMGTSPTANTDNGSAKVVSDWRDVEVIDVITKEKFKISDFSDKPVLLESFAVWCPTCKKQQDVIKDLHEEIGDSAVSISLDTDPNEDGGKVLQHANRYDFDWLFAVSPNSMTQRLIKEFGVSIVSAPGAPVVLVCPGDQKARFLDRGVKSVTDLKSEIAKGC